MRFIVRVGPRASGGVALSAEQSQEFLPGTACCAPTKPRAIHAAEWRFRPSLGLGGAFGYGVVEELLHLVTGLAPGVALLLTQRTLLFS
jgi:hypothetical protein